MYLQGDYGQEEDLVGPGENATWWGVGLWGTYDVTPAVGLALRGDYIDDKDGARTSGVLGFPANTRHKFGSATATLNIKAFPGALIRPELRYDRSNLPVYDDVGSLAESGLGRIGSVVHLLTDGNGREQAGTGGNGRE